MYKVLIAIKFKIPVITPSCEYHNPAHGYFFPLETGTLVHKYFYEQRT